MQSTTASAIAVEMSISQLLSVLSIFDAICAPRRELVWRRSRPAREARQEQARVRLATPTSASSKQRRSACLVPSCLLKRVSELQDTQLISMAADNLQANR